MVQEFNVLRCFSCKTFQVHQVKKAKKWACKVCGEKQSLKKVYGQGSAPDCRKHVQKLNTMQGEYEYEHMKGEIVTDAEHIDSYTEEKHYFEREDVHEDLQVSAQSKWEKFVETQHPVDDQNQESELWHGMPVTTDRTAFEGKNQKKKHQRKRKSDYQDDTQISEPVQKRCKDLVKKDQNKLLISQESRGNCYNPEDENVKFQFEKEMNGKENGEWKSTQTRFDPIRTSRFERNETTNLSSDEQESVQDTSGKNTYCNKTFQGERKQNDMTNSSLKQSKWSKFLGNSMQDSPTKPCENSIFSDENMNSLSNAHEGHLLLTTSTQVKNTNSFGVPQFVSNAKAMRPAQQCGVEPTGNSEQHDNVSSVSSSSLFQIEDGLENDWWNV